MFLLLSVFDVITWYVVLASLFSVVHIVVWNPKLCYELWKELLTHLCPHAFSTGKCDLRIVLPRKRVYERCQILSKSMFYMKAFVWTFSQIVFAACALGNGHRNWSLIFWWQRFFLLLKPICILHVVVARLLCNEVFERMFFPCPFLFFFLLVVYRVILIGKSSKL